MAAGLTLSIGITFFTLLLDFTSVRSERFMWQAVTLKSRVIPEPSLANSVQMDPCNNNEEFGFFLIRLEKYYNMYNTIEDMYENIEIQQKHPATPNNFCSSRHSVKYVGTIPSPLPVVFAPSTPLASTLTYSKFRDPCPFHVCDERTDAQSEIPANYSDLSSYEVLYGYIIIWIAISSLVKDFFIGPIFQSIGNCSTPQPSYYSTSHSSYVQVIKKDFHTVPDWNKELASNNMIELMLLPTLIEFMIALMILDIVFIRLIEHKLTSSSHVFGLFDILLLFSIITPIQSTVQVNPSGQFIAPLHGNAVFICTCSACDHPINWFLNGSAVANSSDFIAIEHTQHGSFSFSRLALMNLSISYNLTQVQCALGTEGDVWELSDSTILLIQGHLSTVKNLSCSIQNSSIYLTWTAPFTLDLSGIHPDIEGYRVYGVNNVNSTIEFSEVNITEFSLDIHSKKQCFPTGFIVAPINVVGGGDNSTVSCFTFNRPELLEGCVILNVEEGHVCTLNMSDPVCDASLTCTNDRKRQSEIMKNIEENVITFRLEANQHYNCTLSAFNSAGSSTAHFNLSTFDILNATVLAEEDNTIAIRVQYNEDSEAHGALFSFVFMAKDGKVDFDKSALLALDRNTSLDFNSTFSLYPGYCEIFVYDIEKNETLSTGIQYPAVATNLSTTGNGQGNAVQRCHECLISTYPGTIIIYDCELGDIEVVARSNILNKAHTLYVNQSTDLEFPVILRVESDGEYEVTIWPIGAFDRMCSEQVMVMDTYTMDTYTISSADFSPVIAYTAVLTAFLLLIFI